MGGEENERTDGRTDGHRGKHEFKRCGLIYFDVARFLLSYEI